MPLHYNRRLRFAGRLRLNEDVRKVLRWEEPEAGVIQLAADAADTLTFVVTAQNLPTPTFSLVSGTLPTGVTLEQSGALVSDGTAVVSSVVEITIRAESQGFSEDRTFTLAMVGDDFGFRWLTPEGLAAGDDEGVATDIQFQAYDPFNLPITYTRVAGPLPPGMTLDNSTGLLTGFLPYGDGDQTYTFTLQADNGVMQIEREFIVEVFDIPSGPVPVWQTPKGDIFSQYEGTEVDFQFVAVDPNELPMTFVLLGGNLPPNTLVDQSGHMVGMLAPVPDDTLFRAIIGVTNDNGQTHVKRTFNFVVKKNFEPEWISPDADEAFSEVEGYPLTINFVATDENTDQQVVYSTNSNVPGLTLDAANGVLSGTLDLLPGEESVEYPVTIFASDGLKQTARSFQVTVLRDLEPVWDIGDAFQQLESTAFATSNSDAAHDPNGKPLVYSIINGTLPNGLTFDANTGVISGVLPPAPDADVVIPLTLAAFDGRFTSEHEIEITSWQNTPPVWNTPEGDLGVFGIEGKSFSFAFSASDRETPNGLIYFSDDVLPPGLSMVNNSITGTLDMLPGEDDVTFEFEVKVTDGVFTVARTFSFLVQKNRPPVWDTPVGSIGEMLGMKHYEFSFSAHDPNGQPVTYELVAQTQVPAAFNFNGTAGKITGIMPANIDQDIVYTITVAALDGDHEPVDFPSVLRTFTFTCKVNLPPVWVTNAGTVITAWEGENFSYALQGYDPEGEDVTYYHSTGQLWVADTGGASLNTQTGLITGKIPDLDQDTNVSFTVYLDDNTRGDLEIYRTPRTFTIEGKFASLPEWVTPEGFVASKVEAEVVSFQFEAIGVGNAPHMIYSLVSGSLPPGLTLDPDTGIVSGTMPFVTEDTPYAFMLRAFNGIKQSERSFYIVAEKNLAPYFVTEEGEVANSLGGVPFSYTIEAVDPNGDHGSPLQYSFANGTNVPGCVIESDTGEIHGNLPPNEPETIYPFDVAVTDGLETVYRSFTITQTPNELPIFTTPEGLFAWPLDNTIGFTFSFQATDPEIQPLTYTLVGGTLPTGLNFEANGLVWGDTPEVVADEVYPLTIEVADAYNSVSGEFELKIVDNLPPTWVTPAGDLGLVIAGEDVSIQLEATDPYGTTLTYSLVSGSTPPGIDVSPTGIVGGTLPLSFTADAIYTFTVEVTDGVFPVQRTFSIDAQRNLPPLWVTGAGTLGSVHVGSPFTALLEATDDHSRPITYTVTGGELPPGLTLVANSGEITGTAGFDSPANYVFGVTASDGIKETARGFSIALLNDPPVFSTNADLGDFIEGTEVNVTINAIDPEGHAVTYEASGLQGTMQISSGGHITGTLPNVVQDQDLTFTVTADDSNVTSQKAFTMHVKFVSPPVWQNSAVLPSGTEQFPYGPVQVTALANNATVTYEVVSGNFPSTLTLAANGVISGDLPVAETDTTYSFEIEATALGKRSSRTFSLLVKHNLAPVWVTNAALPDLRSNAGAFSQTFTATDQNPITYELVDQGTLPPWLQFNFGAGNTTVSLTGNIPTVSNDVIVGFTLGADDTLIRTDRNFSFKVLANKGPNWNTPGGSIATINEGSNLNFTFSATDPEGDTPITYVVTDWHNTPTANISMTANGVLSGVMPKVTANTVYTIDVIARDAFGMNSAPRTFTLTNVNDVSTDDPYANSIILLMHMDGGNGSTTFVDEVKARTFTVQNASQTTAQSKFGVTGLGINQLGSTPSRVAVPFESNLSMSTANMTIELWVYSQDDGVILQRGNTGNSTFMHWRLFQSGGNLTFVGWRGGSGNSVSLNLGALPQNSWHHVAISREGATSTYRGFVDGVQKASQVQAALITDTFTYPLDIGYNSSTGASQWTGFVDDLRLTEACRYTGNFSVPTKAFPNPSQWTTAANTVIATGYEGTSLTHALSTRTTVVADDEGSDNTIDFRVASINGSGTYSFTNVTGETARLTGTYGAAGNTTVYATGIDSNGNWLPQRPFIVTSIAAVPTNLKYAWRFNGPTGTSDFSAVVGNLGAPALGSSTASASYQTAPAPHADGTAALLSGNTTMWWNTTDQMNIFTGTKNWTIEMWVYVPSASLSGRSNPTMFCSGAGGTNGFRIFRTDAGLPSPDGRLGLGWGGSNFSLRAPSVMAGDQWNHIAITKSGTTARFFLNGVSGTAVNLTSLGDGYLNNQPIYLNGLTSAGGYEPYLFPSIYVRTLQMWDIARWTASFTPTWPVTEFDW